MPVTSIQNGTQQSVPWAVPKKKQIHLVLDTPIKSVADKKLYKTIRLRNGLTALLISDPTTDDHWATCALSVRVGGFSDPLNIMGMAHFVEHMVFMGSTKYPDENEFSSLITQYGGSTNGITEPESMIYHFDIPESELSKAMDIFSQLFISPLMKKEAMQRERMAIDSEFVRNLASEYRRFTQLLYSMFPEGHPARNFMGGNLRTLLEDVKDDEWLHCEAHKFRRRYYSAHRMTVALQANMDLSTLEEYVEQIFGQIPSNGIPPEDFSSCDYSADTVTPEFRSLYYVKPFNAACQLRITWNLRSFLSEYKTKPELYVTHLLGHEGKGSLSSYLRKKAWALEVKSSILEHTSMFCLMTLKIELSKDGLEHVDEVIEAVFSYLNKLRYCGPIERIFNELKSIQGDKFRYSERIDPTTFVTQLVQNMHVYPPEHYIVGKELYHKYDPKVIMDLLNSLRADMANIMVVSSNHAKPVQYDAKEEWFGTEYKREEIPQEWLQRWMNVAPYSEFQIPEKNVYIPTNFDIIPLATPYVEAAKKLGLDLETSDYKEILDKTAGDPILNDVTFTKDNLNVNIENFRLKKPNLFREDLHMRVVYTLDIQWLPTALLFFHFLLPISLLTPRESCLLDVWSDILQQKLKEEIYPAQVAGCSHKMFVTTEGLALEISGFSENLHLLVDLTTSYMRASMDDVSPQLFEAVRDRRARIYHNQVILPSDLANQVLHKILVEAFVTSIDKAAWVYKISLKEVQDFGPRMLKKLDMRVTIKGNIPWYQAINISENIHNDLKWKHLDIDDMYEFGVRQLPLGERRVRVKSLNELSTSSFVMNYYQGYQTIPQDKAIVQTIVSMMSGPIFDILRSEEQLGYTVLTELEETLGVIGFSVHVETGVDKFSVQHVEKRIDAFLRNFVRYLPYVKKHLGATNMSIAQPNPPRDLTMTDKMEKIWMELISGKYNFASRLNDDTAISKLMLADITNWLKRHCFPGRRTSFRKLSVQVVGYDSTDEEYEDEDPVPAQMTSTELTYLDAGPGESPTEFITDIDSFTKHLILI